MSKLTNEEIDGIKKDAEENWENNIGLAAAAFVHGAGMVLKVGKTIAPFFDKKRIGQIKGQITKAENNKKVKK